MAHAAGTIWEARTGGSDSNGGGFDSTVTSPGTDYSQQNSAQVTYTDLAVDATTNTDVTSAANPFTSAHVGNVLKVTSGAGWTVGWYSVRSVAGVIARLDRSPAATSTTGGNGKLGGAIINPEVLEVSNGVAAGNIIYVASGTYTSTTTRTLTNDGTVAAGQISIVGYLAGGTRNTNVVTEASMPIFTSATSSNHLFTFSGSDYRSFKNIKFTHTGGVRGQGINVSSSSQSTTIDNCVFDGVIKAYDNGWGGVGAIFKNVTVRNASNPFSLVSNQGVVFDSVYIVSPTSNGIVLGLSVITNTVIIRNTIISGAGGHGVLVSTTTSTNNQILLDGLVCYGGSQSGVRFEYTTGRHSLVDVKNSIFYNNANYGVSCATAGVVDREFSAFSTSNAYGANSSGARQNFLAGSDITLSADPFTNAAGGDFSLNSTAGGGAMLRQLGWPTYIGAMGASSTNSYPDVGAAEHQESPISASPSFAVLGG